jgi:hypothetical protein
LPIAEINVGCEIPDKKPVTGNQQPTTDNRQPATGKYFNRLRNTHKVTAPQTRAWREFIERVIALTEKSAPAILRESICAS